MTFSPLIDQRVQNPDGSEDCGETSFTMVAEHLGHNVTEQDVLNIHYGPTDENEMLVFCSDFGLKGCYITSSGFDNNDKLVMALIHDNNNADPDINGSYLHWIVVYAQDAQNVYCANPWGGRDITYPLSQFNPAYIAGIVVPVSTNLVNQPNPSVGGVQSTMTINDSTVCTLDHNSVATVKFASPLSSCHNVVVCNGDANEANGASDMVLNVVQPTVSGTGFSVQCIKANQPGGLPQGTLVRINWVAFGE